jgi:NB-ARC domain
VKEDLMTGQEQKFHSNNYNKQRRFPILFWIIIVVVVITVIGFASAVLIIIKSQGIIRGSVILTIISIVIGVLFGLLGLTISFFQWYYPRHIGEHNASSTSSQSPSSNRSTTHAFSVSQGPYSDRQTGSKDVPLIAAPSLDEHIKEITHEELKNDHAGSKFDQEDGGNMDPQPQNKPIQIENVSITNSAIADVASSVQIPNIEIETIQSKRHRLHKINDSIRVLGEERIKSSNVTMSSLKAKLEFEERNAAILDLEIREELRTVYSPLPRQSYTRFIGRKEKRVEILAVLESRSTSPIIAIDGIGGAGKTALARELAQLSLEANTFYVVVWESDKPTEFTGGGILPQSTDEISFENLLDRIARKLGYFDVSSLRTMREKKDLVRRILNAERYLIVIDNLETIKEYRDLVNNLDGMFDNSKAILTTRKKVAEFRDVYSVSLGGMEFAESIEFLKSEATERGEAGRVILEANESMLERIYITTGGLPLAMRLVVGQTTRSSPNTVLKHLETVNYQKIQNPESNEDVYNQFFKFIYWDSWNQLSDNGKQLLIELGAFDPTEGVKRNFLSTMSELSSSGLDDAASELVEFSLVRRSFEGEQEIFYLHPLTHHFVQNDV